MSSKKMLTVNQIVEMLNVTRATVYSLMNRGELPYVMVGKRRRIDAVEVEKYLERNKTDTITIDSGSGQRSHHVTAA